MPSDLRIGRIAYTNVLPLYAAFDAGAVEAPGTFVTVPPAALNAMLDAGEIDVGPISVGHYLRPRPAAAVPYAHLPHICIKSRGAVRSVLLVSEIPPGLLDGRTLSVTRESATGRALVEVILRGRYGARPAFAPVDDALGAARAGRPTLLIGDRALDAAVEFPAEWIYDLGSLWNQWTGEEMVYAVWAERPRRLAEADRERVIGAFRAAHAWSRTHPEKIVARARAMVPRPEAAYAEYFETLGYELDAAALRGMKTFKAKLERYGVDTEVRGVSR